MKAKHSVWKNKLAKTTLFMTVILVAALFLGTAVSAGITTNTTPKAKKDMYIPEVSSTGIFSSQCPQVMATSTPFNPSPLGDVIFSQGPMDPYGAWNFYTSSATFPYTVADDFVVGDQIGDVHWYGCALIWQYGWIVGDPTGMTFEIKFYEQGTGGIPGAEVATYSDLVPEVVATGTIYSWIGTSYYWEVSLDTSVSLTEGWVSIQSTYCPDGSNFLWLNSPDGDFDGVQNQYGSWVYTYNSFAFDLTAPDIQLDHDIGVTKIKAPVSGNAGVITPEITVKNFGLYDEYSVPISFEIGKKQYNTILTENFEGDFPPAGWTVQTLMGGAWQRNDYWGRPNYAGTGYCADADVSAAYSYPMLTLLISPPIDLGTNEVSLFFNSYEYVYYSDALKVDITTDGGATWENLWAVQNTYEYGVLKAVEIPLSDYSGIVQIRFNYWAPYWDMYWEVDDVKIAWIEWIPDYPIVTQYVDILAGQTLNLTFPEWTPSDLGVNQNVNVLYKATATSALVGDEKPNNDVKTKEFSLWYGWLHDVKVLGIPSPVSGNAEVQIPAVDIQNVGQMDVTANVNMVISKIVYGEPWTMEQPGEWQQYNYQPYGTDWTPPVAYLPWSMIQGDYAYLKSCAVDTSAEPTLTLSFKSFVDWYSDADINCYIKISTDDVTWVDITPWSNPIVSNVGPATYTIDVTDYISTTTYVMFEFSGYYFDLDYWYIDDFSLASYFVDFSGAFPPVSMTLIPEYDNTTSVDIAAGETKNVVFTDYPWTPEDLPVLMNIDYQADVEVTLGGLVPMWNYGFEDYQAAFPPAGWTIYNNGYNYWMQSTSGMRSGVACARCQWDYPAPNDDWLVTKPTVVIPGGVFELWVDTYNAYDEYEIYMSTTGNTPADFLAGTMLAGVYYPAPTVYTHYVFPMTGYEGQMVWFAVRYIGYDAWYVYVDDVTFPDFTFEGFENTVSYWPGWTQTAYGTDPDNKWFATSAGTSPTAYPPEGALMAEYYTYYISSGNSNLLTKNDAFDFSTPNDYILTFQMYHDTMYASSADCIYVVASPDGVSYYYWTDPVYRASALQGVPDNTWQTHSVSLNGIIDYFGWGWYNIGFYGVSAYGSNCYIDDVIINSVAAIDDGNPADNVMHKIFTLSYIHDVGVASITEPQGPPKRDLIWDNDLAYGEALLACQYDPSYGELGSCADDFQFVQTMDVTEVAWVGGFWNGAPGQPDWTITIYSDASGPGDIVYGPVTIPYADCNEEFLQQSGTSYYYGYTATLPEIAVIPAGTYWIGFQAQLVFPPQSGFAGHTAPQQMSEMMFKSEYFGYPDWVPGSTVFGTVYDLAFQLNGQIHQGGGGNWPPGTYPVAGIVQNMGVTYTESNIPVNAQITNDTGVVVYDFNAEVPGPLAPGEMATVLFPDITIPWEASAEGDYKLTMKTMLVGDENSQNDKKTKTWVIQIPDTTPPTTTADVTGTMGQNGWYVSNVQVTLSATDAKWPEGVNYTMYKVDDGAWTLYEIPIVVSTDGEHTVYFYSVDKAVPPNVETEKSVSFKIDKTAPVFTDYTFTPQNALKTKWLCVATVSDPTSGIDYVEFYVDDALIGSVDAPGPYEFEFSGKPENNSQALAYDLAGNSALSPIAQYVELNYHTQVLQQKEL